MKKRNFRRMVSFLLTFIMLIGNINIIVSAEETFDWSDVSRYYPFSSWAVDTGIKYKLIFLENNRRETMRYEVACLLFDISSVDEKEQSNFSDISELYENVRNRIIKVANAGIIRGYEDGTFRPYNSVTRAEFVTMLNKSGIIKEDGNIIINFEDVKGHWAEESINKVASLGIVTGKSESSFCPEETITPQEIFIIMDRLVNLNYISKEQLIQVMTDTFLCKVYGEKEEYIIEVMYKDFDKVQNDIKYMWLFKEYYDPENWQELATYNDLGYAKYFTTVYEAKLKEDKYAPHVAEMFKNVGLENDIEKYGNNVVTIRDIFYVFAGNTGRDESYSAYVNWYKLNAFGQAEASVSPDILKFTNASEFSNKDKYAFIRNSKSLYETELMWYFGNDSIYFPMDAPVTKYMLNYIILKFYDKYDTVKRYVDPHGACEKFLGFKAEIETDVTKMPSNYDKYPFIIKGIPKEVYEWPMFYSSQEHIDPIDRYYGSHKFEKRDDESFSLTASNYFDLILNVDYRTIDEDEFAATAKKNIFGFEDTYREFAQYVKDNHIILKGKGMIVPGFKYTSEPLEYARVIVQFEVISADTRKELIVAGPYEAEYPKDKYCLVYDQLTTGVMNVRSKEVEWSKVMTAYLVQRYTEIDPIF